MIGSELFFRAVAYEAQALATMIAARHRLADD
jgi:hypothetical protein